MQRRLWLSGSLSMLCCARGMWLLNTHKSKSAIQNRKHASIKPWLLQLVCCISYFLNLNGIIAVHMHLTFWFALITLKIYMVNMKSAYLSLFSSLLFLHCPWNKISSTHVLPLSSCSVHRLHNNFPLTLWHQSPVPLFFVHVLVIWGHLEALSSTSTVGRVLSWTL